MCHHSSSHLMYQLHSQPMLSPMMTSPLLLRILSELLHHCKQYFDQIRQYLYKVFVTRPGHKCRVKTNTTQFVSTIYIYIYIFGNDYRRDSPARAMPTIISTYIHKTQCGRKRYQICITAIVQLRLCYEKIIILRIFKRNSLIFQIPEM